MQKCLYLLFLLFFIMASFSSFAGENEWQLKKDKNGIKVYAKEKEDMRFYMYKVVTKISVSPEVVYNQVVDFRENLKYMKVVDSLKILDHEKDRRYRNYMHFNMPWPVKNREMVMEMSVTKDQDGIYLESNDLPEALPENRDAIRMEDFKEKWSIEKGANPDESQITVTGWVDPGGSIPAWVVDLFNANTPFRFISGILKELRKDQ
ncbi:MAG: START domain-containing protein [Bacteroidota bacterium]